MVLLVLLCMLSACAKKEIRHRASAIADRAAMPALEGTDVTTLISDSGVTRYRIKAKKWLVFDKADTPYWEFPEGIYLEKFNMDLEADATVEADYAYYNEPAQRWTLKGNVEAMNLEGEKFETPLLYWDQKSESVYSDSSITITRETSIIKGVGFQSNQEMTNYTIQYPTGVFPIEE
ncbi:MAG: LPS export ABC transporter periplasmic protein LptC [Paludibacteraceae bacterium]|nr:LPS export ABC transporter periplasmic protein LptC [Paludibacteraceae bacterium]